MEHDSQKEYDNLVLYTESDANNVDTNVKEKDDFMQYVDACWLEHHHPAEILPLNGDPGIMCKIGERSFLIVWKNTLIGYSDALLNIVNDYGNMFKVTALD